MASSSTTTSSKSLVDDMLTKDVDESTIKQIVGTLEIQLSNNDKKNSNSENKINSININHVSSSASSRVLDTSLQQTPTILKTTTTSSIIPTILSTLPVSATITTIPSTTTVSPHVSTVVHLDKNIIINNTNNNSLNNSKRILITPQSIGKNIIINQQLIPNHFKSSTITSTTTALTSLTSTTTNLQVNTSAPSHLATISGALPASGYIHQVTNASQTINATGNIFQASGTSLKITPTGITNGSTTHSQQANRLFSGNNLSISAINSPIVITSTPSSSSVTLGTQSVNSLNKTQQTLNMTKQPHALLLTPSKDGGPPTAMVVQTSPFTNSSQINCETNSTFVRNNQGLSNLITSLSSSSSSTPSVTSGTTTVFAVSRPVTSTTQQLQQPQILTQVVSNPNLLHQGLVLNVSASRPVGATNTITAANANIRNLAPRMQQNLVRLSPQILQNRPLGPTITLPPNLRGTILLKTESGQLQLVNVGGNLSNTGSPLIGSSYRVQLPTVSSASTGTGQNVTTIRPPINITTSLPVSVASPMQPQQQQPQRPQVTSVTQPITIQTTSANQNSSASTPSQMSPNTAKKKCKNFLSTLIRLASDQPQQVADNVKNLIQGLIDGVIQPEEFTNQLQKELNSSPQPCLVPFLKKSLPYLRHSLMVQEMTIEGVRSPRLGTVQLPQLHQGIPGIQLAQATRPGGQPTIRLLTTQNIAHFPPGTTVLTRPQLTQHQAQQHLPQTQMPVSISTTLVNSGATPHPTHIQLTPQQQQQLHQQQQHQLQQKQLQQQQQSYNTTKIPSTPVSKTKASAKSRSPATAVVVVNKEKEKKNFSTSLRDDDDINDVAAMGGVNLQEESQRLATNAELVGTQIRSCKDENFLFTNPLQKCINEIASKFGLDEVSSEVVSLVSHAAQERLKTLVEKLGIIAEHRIENIRNDPRFEVTQDVRGQVKFLEELDKIEKKRHEEQEREMLLRAAKSRSKLEDPEQLKLKQKAKEMQRAELEEARQREANETALLAIGPRKKIKLSSNNIANNNISNFNNTSSNSFNHNSSPFSNSTKSQIRRVKRVNMRDLQFLMEQERETVRTPMLYRSYAK